MISNNMYNTGIGNEDYESICLQYYLTQNVTGGKYRIPISMLEDYIVKVHPDFILISKFGSELQTFFGISEDTSPYLIEMTSFSPLSFKTIRLK